MSLNTVDLSKQLFKDREERERRRGRQREKERVEVIRGSGEERVTESVGED